MKNLLFHDSHKVIKLTGVKIKPISDQRRYGFVFAQNSILDGYGESIKGSVFGNSVLGGSFYLTSDLLRQPHKPNP